MWIRLKTFFIISSLKISFVTAMEGSADVECGIVIVPEVKWLTVRKVAQDVLMFVFHKQEVIDKRPSPELSFVPEITAEFLRNLSLSVWIDSYINEHIWKKYFDNNFERMTTTPYLFAEYVYFACHILNDDISNAYESFYATLSLVTHFVLTCWQRERKEFLNTCVELFCQFFYNRIGINFEDHGGWQNFNEYLVNNHDDLHTYHQLMRNNVPEYELFKMIEKDNEQETEPYVIGGISLETLTHDRVEYDEETVDFAESVARKIKKLCKKTLEEILLDFEETNKQVEERYRRTVGEATGGMATDSEQSSLQEDQEVKANVEKSPSQKNQAVKASGAKKSPLQKNQAVKASGAKKSPLQKNQAVKESGAKKSPLQKNQAVYDQANKSQSSSTGVQKNAFKNTPSNPATQEPHKSSKSTKAERAKILLQTMLDDIPKMYELIKFLCGENPKQA